MNTVFMLLAKYETPVIPLKTVCADFFHHMSAAALERKSLIGEIALPIIRIENSQKAARGVHVSDLAQWIDQRRAEAVAEIRKVTT